MELAVWIAAVDFVQSFGRLAITLDHFFASGCKPKVNSIRFENLVAVEQIHIPSFFIHHNKSDFGPTIGFEFGTLTARTKPKCCRNSKHQISASHTDFILL